MTASPSAEELRLTEEITDLSSVLADLPAPLRERGLFDSYGTRLTLLQEQLLGLRLERLINQNDERLPKHPTDNQRPSTGQSRSAGVIGVADAAKAIEELRDLRHRQTVRFRYSFWAGAAASLFVGILIATDRTNLWHFALADLGLVVAFASAGQIVFRHLEEMRNDAEHRLELLHNDLELLLSFYRAERRPEPQLYERTLKRLDEAHIE